MTILLHLLFFYIYLQASNIIAGNEDIPTTEKRKCSLQKEQGLKKHSEALSAWIT